jgi:pyruvate/2-oxoglutarate dehydrogenase complex dihydrolipoamide dehydrogenase (E3) component
MSSTPTTCSLPPGATTTSTDIGWRPSAWTRRRTSSRTDGHLRAGDRLWAIGDITGHGAFTHVSRYQAAGAVADILGRTCRRPTTAPSPASRSPIRSSRRSAQTEQQAREAGLDVRVGLAQVERSARGWLHGPGTKGIVKVVEDAARGVLVGATVLAPYGGEVIGMLVTAVHGEVPVERLRTMHYAYPTFHRPSRRRSSGWSDPVRSGPDQSGSYV